MTLPQGSHLGRYEIIALVGAGGMGEVYRARDTRLQRTVAVKVLPPQFRQDADWRHRFEREAHVISSLSHPHICTLFDIGHHDGTDYLVMEFLEGETLSSRLQQGPLALDVALRIAIEAAEALDEAHRRGVVHRDLKPGNMMLTATGAKLLDFGLAKARESTTEGLSGLPTVPGSMTARGTILGTYEYMSPEQVEGDQADARADIFALGAVIYEMVSGRRPFEGKTPASVIGAILKDTPPPLSSFRPLTPLVLDHIVGRCLMKDRRERWQSVKDLAIQLRFLLDGVYEQSAAAKQPGSSPRRGWRHWLPWTVAAAALAGLAVTLPTALRPRPGTDASLPVVRFDVTPPEGTVLTTGGASGFVPHFALSPDGQKLAFVAGKPGEPPVIWVRALGEPDAMQLRGTADASSPFWSPDGRFLAFFASGELRRVPVHDGGAPSETICAALVGPGGSWSANDEIVYATSARDGLYAVSARGGEPRRATTLDPGRKEIHHLSPLFLPDGRHFLFGVESAASPAWSVRLGSLDSPETRLVVETTSPVFSHANFEHLIFERDGQALAQAFDRQTRRLTGDPTRLPLDTQRDRQVTALGAGGSTVAYTSGLPVVTQLTWLDSSGTSLGTLGPAGIVSVPVISRDGRVAAYGQFDVAARRADIWIADLSRAGLISRMSSSGSAQYFPLWSPDGARLAFGAVDTGALDIYEIAASGSGPVTRLLQSTDWKFPTDWSADGRFLVVDHVSNTTSFDIWLHPRDGSPGRALVATPFAEFQGQLSADGR